MNTHLHCIALRSTAVSDSRTLLSVWTREHGRLTLAFPAGSSREGRRRRALALPMAMFEGSADVRPGREIISMRDFLPMPGSLAVAVPEVPRLMVATFLAEVLDSLLRRSAPDKSLSDFLFASAQALAAIPAEDVPNFHLVFLARFTRPAGIMPDLGGCSRMAVFDMRDACYRSSAPMHSDYIEAGPARLVRTLVMADYGNMGHIKLTRQQRREALGHILAYLSIHMGALPPLRSLDVLHSL